MRRQPFHRIMPSVAALGLALVAGSPASGQSPSSSAGDTFYVSADGAADGTGTSGDSPSVSAVMRVGTDER